MTTQEMAKEVRRLSNLLDEGLKVLRDSAQELAEKERTYRKAKAEAWLNIQDGTVAEREAQVDSETADERFDRDVAESLRRAALESVRARATQISAIQSLLSAHRAEAEFTRTAP